MNKKIAYIFLLFGILFKSLSVSAAVYVNEKDVSTALKEEFLNEGYEDEIEIEFFGGKTNYEFLEGNAFKIMIVNLKIDETQERFSSQAEIYVDGQVKGKTELSGKFYKLAEVYVPSRNIKKGEIIKEGDLKPIKIRNGRIKNTHITDKEKLYNKEAKRMLKEGKLIVDNDVGEKIIIRKGDVITALYATPHMQISAKVEAQEDGAKGEKIELLNNKSQKHIYGEVIDAETVKVDIQ